MNYKQRKITKLAKKKFNEFYKEHNDKYWENTDGSRFSKLKEGMSIVKWAEESKTYPYFKKIASKEVKKSLK